MRQKSYRVQAVKPIAGKKKKHKRVKGYWKRYHSATSNDKAEHEICKNVCKELGNPYPKNILGRKAKIEPWEIAAMHAFRRHKGFAYRDVERASKTLLGFFIDHSWVGKTLQRIPPIYFIKAVQLIAGRIKALFIKHDKNVHIVDSTGITTDRKAVSKKGKEYMYFMKLHIIIQYWLRLGILVIVTCLATGNNVQDGTGMRRMLPDVEGDGDFFGDKGYSGKQNRKKIRQQGFNPQIKPKGEQSKKEAEKNPFNNDAYKQIRGRIECIFGGTTTRHDNKTKCRLEITRQNDCNLYALSHNLHTYLRAKIAKSTLIWRQPLYGSRFPLQINGQPCLFLI